MSYTKAEQLYEGKAKKVFAVAENPDYVMVSYKDDATAFNGLKKGQIAGNTTLPVIAIPVKAKALEGVDALLSSVMMPPGVPVATVGIDAAANAGYLAAEILSVYNDELADKLTQFKKKQNEKNLAADAKMQEAAKEI